MAATRDRALPAAECLMTECSTTTGYRPAEAGTGSIITVAIQTIAVQATTRRGHSRTELHEASDRGLAAAFGPLGHADHNGK
jgi:hypothetical protein